MPPQRYASVPSASLEELTDRIIQETHLVDDVPARLDLLKYSSVGVIGNRRKVTDLLKNLLVSLSTLHFFRDVRIVGVFDPEEEEEWKSMRWLPHIWDDELQWRKRTCRFLCEIP